ncbi:hypothetical protein SAMN05444481_10672 [Flavobacterium frigidimaris]|jgi:hypothetical protein|nr:hypothetical protein SAMN05444481_10672 [Flavobacterium frigidimaris]
MKKIILTAIAVLGFTFATHKQVDLLKEMYLFQDR